MADTPATALLGYVQHGTYPDSEYVAADLPTSAFRELRGKIANAQTQARTEISKVSRQVAPDVDGWIKQAQQLQNDIQRSRAIAREVVVEAENAASLKSARVESENKLALLKIEVDFNDRLRRTLETNQRTASHINHGQDLATEGQLVGALQEYEKARRDLEELRPFRSTAPVQLLHNRSQRLRQTLEGEVISQWDRLVTVDEKRQRISIKSEGSGKTSSLKSTVDLMKKLLIFDSKVRKLCEDLDDTIFTPRLMKTRHAKASYKTQISGNELSLSSEAPGQFAADLLDDLTSTVDFLNRSLPAEVSSAVSDILMPDVISRVISDWLSPSVPTSIEDLPKFEDLSRRVNELAESLANHGWLGGAELNDWIKDGPKVWLSRRRESLLILVRDVLSSRLSETKTVERIETQLVSRQDIIAQTSGTAGESWDDAWEEDESSREPTADVSSVGNGEEEDASAWDFEADDGQPTTKNGHSKDTGDEAEAWGWDEPDSPSAPKATVKPSKTEPPVNGTSSDKPQERELTLRETYNITSVPDALLRAIVELTQDASTLQQPLYNNSPLAVAAPALYTLPTLLLAGYRALAPTFYATLPGGNMYLYNDLVRLTSELTTFSASLSASDPLASRAKLPEDIKSLTSFSARAYGREMEAQRTILRDLLDGTQGFANCTEQPFGGECANAVAMVVDRVRAVAEEWRPILSRSAWLQSLGSLLSAVVNKITVDVCDLSDISEPESGSLKGFCDEVSKLGELFVQEEEGAPEGKRDMTGVYTPNWFRFQYLAEILESSLADIRYLWQEGELKLEFEVGEVVDLIEALFADSEHRRRAIAEIRRS